MFNGAGRLLGSFGSQGKGDGEFLKPSGVAVGPNHTVYVTDRCNKRVEVFTASGRFVETFGKGALQAPTFLALDRAGNVYVSDYHRVVKFSAAGAAVAATAPAQAAHHNGLDIICRHVAETNYP
jgi:DNA-binding beta-propeller fold protein YncE